MPNNALSKLNFAYIIGLWCVLTLFNINKAYHIDDTFHLEAAEHISKAPFSPMSGKINWKDYPTSMYDHNQPPFFFYLIAFVTTIFGNSEIVLHLFLSIFTFFSLFYFFKLLILLRVKEKLFFLIIFSFCPAFIVNQNLMIDIPILSISLALVYHLIIANNTNTLHHYFIASGILSVGLLFKYSVIPLFFVILLSSLFSKNYKGTLSLFIPILVITIWSLWNIKEFDAIHILNRNPTDISFDKAVGFFGTLGAISFFSIALIGGLFSHKLIKVMLFTVVLLFIVCVPLVYNKIISEVTFNSYLNYFFIGNGCFIMGHLLIISINKFLKNNIEYLKSSELILFLVIMGSSLFLALFSPFNATRHVLLLVPFILLHGRNTISKAPKAIKTLTLITSVLLGTLIGISDWKTANFYREAAYKIDLSENKVWSIGHWGWQWYSKNAGMKVYGLGDELDLKKNDLLVYPNDVSKQTMAEGVIMETLFVYTQPSDFFTFFSTKKYCSMYYSTHNSPAWSLSNSAIDSIQVCRIHTEFNIENFIKKVESSEEWLDIVNQKAINNNITLDSMLILEAKWMLEYERSIRTEHIQP
jgi:hypothetical protein